MLILNGCFLGILCREKEPEDAEKKPPENAEIVSI